MDIIMPQLGETVLEGSITTWYKKPGDSVAADEPLFEVETDKVSTAIPAPAPGVLREILIDAGITVKVGTRLAVIDTLEAPIRSSEPGRNADVTPGTAVGTGNTDSAALNTGTPRASNVAAAQAKEMPGRLAAQRPTRANRDGKSKLSPLVRRLLAEAQLAPEQVQGSGRDGRITREDVLHQIRRPQQTALPPMQAASHPGNGRTMADSAAAQDPTASADRVVPLNRIRRATAAHMVRSIATSVHTLQAVEVDFQNVERVRLDAGARWKASEGFTLTYLPFVCAAACEALVDFPLINSSFVDDSLRVHRRIHLGIAVDLGFDGLVAPVLRDADSRNLRGLARDIQTLVQKARSNTLQPDDLSGGTYTISNSGSFGTLITAPIINQPQVAILSMDGIHKKPVVIETPEGDAIAIRPIGVLAQSFDHRAFDGAYSAAFLRRVKQVLETRPWLSQLN